MTTEHKKYEENRSDLRAQWVRAVHGHNTKSTREPYCYAAPFSRSAGPPLGAPLRGWRQRARQSKLPRQNGRASARAALHTQSKLTKAAFWTTTTPGGPRGLAQWPWLCGFGPSAHRLVLTLGVRSRRDQGGSESLGPQNVPTEYPEVVDPLDRRPRAPGSRGTKPTGDRTRDVRGASRRGVARDSPSEF